MVGCPSPFAARTLQATRRNLDSWCLDTLIADSPVLHLNFNQTMDETDKPGIGDFEGVDSDGTPVIVGQIAWDSSAVLRVHLTITFESTLDTFDFLGPLPSLKTLTGVIEDGFELTSFEECV